MAGAGYKLFNTGDVLTAAQVNTYLNEQTVMVFANSTARTTALSSVLAEGMMSYLQDTNSVEVYNGTSWVALASGDVTEVQAGTGISVASGTGPIPVVTNTMATAINAAGDLIYGTANDTFTRLGIGTAGQVLKVNSGATAPEWGAAASITFAGSSVTDSGAQTLANNTWTALTWNTENYDTDAFHSTSTNTSRFTVPSGKGGYYLLIGTTNWDTNATGNRGTRFYKNGAAIYQHFPEHPNFGGSYPGFTFSLMTAAAVGDYLEMYSWQNSGGNLDMRKQYCNFQCVFLGA